MAENKRTFFERLANGLMGASIGIKDPRALAEMNQRAAREQQEMLGQSRQAATPGMMVQVQPPPANVEPSPISAPSRGISEGANITPPPLGVTGQTIKTPMGTTTLGVTPASKAQLDIEKQKALTSIKAESGAELQASKAGELAERNFLTAQSAADTNLDAFFDFANKQQELFGTKPGAFLGILDKMTFKQKNEYKAAFEGSSRESAAIVGRQLIPGARGLSMTRIFEKSTAEIGGTAESNINNIARTMENSFGNALSSNINDIDVEGNEVKIQDAIIDSKTGKSLSKLSIAERGRAINRLKKVFREGIIERYQNAAYASNPNMLSSKTIDEILARSPRFNNEEEVEAANLPDGTPVLVGGQPFVWRN
jgi:hypothetical protein